MAKEKEITVLVVEPQKHPHVETITNELKTLQKMVDGYIQILYPFDVPVGLVCNEEGKIHNLPLNRALRDGSGRLYDIISGTFLVVGLDNEEGEIRSLTSEEMDVFKKWFHRIEEFEIYADGSVVVLSKRE